MADRADLRRRRAAHKARGADVVRVRMAPRNRDLASASALGAAARRAQGDQTFVAICDLAASGASLTDAMAALSLSQNGVRKNLRDRLGSGSWPPKL